MLKKLTLIMLSPFLVFAATGKQRCDMTIITHPKKKHIEGGSKVNQTLFNLAQGILCTGMPCF